MNDDEKKPVSLDDDTAPKNEQGTEDDTSVKVTIGGSDTDDEQKTSTEAIEEKEADDSDDLLKLDEDTPSEKDQDSLEAALEDLGPEEEVSETDRELERIEGIESAETSKPVVDSEPTLGATDTKDKEVVGAYDDDVPSEITGPVDLEETLPKDKENPVLLAIRKQEQEKKPKRGKTGLVALIFSILLLAAIGGAVYFYMQTVDANTRVTSLESDVATAQAKNTSLQAQLKEDESNQQNVAAESDAYRTIPELEVRFKDTETTKSIVFGYTAVPTDATADAVAVSTKALTKLAVGTGAAAVYPCAFTGNVPTIARYTSDVKIADSTASKLGKKIGDVFYVYTAPVGNCAPTEVAAQTARNAAAKAIYDSLEAIPTATAATAATQQNLAITESVTATGGRTNSPN